MKRIFNFLTLITLQTFLLISIPAFSQEQFQFSDDSESFILQVQAILIKNPNKQIQPYAKDLMNHLLERWNAGRFNKTEKDIIKEISQLMAKDKLANDYSFYSFFVNVNDLAFSSLSHQSIANWLKYTKITYKKGKNYFKDHLKYSHELFSASVLNRFGNMCWYLQDAKYQLDSDTSFSVKMTKGSIICTSKRDSIVINNTSGTFYRESYRWKGNSGKVTWWRFNMDENQVYAELSNYNINMKTAEYQADSVVFNNKKAFKSPIVGRLQDKVFNIVPNANTRFPVFASYRDDYDIKNIFANIDIYGSIGMQGADFSAFGNKNYRAKLTIHRNDTIMAELEAPSFVMRDSRLSSSLAKLFIGLDNDSLVHTGLKLQYDDSRRELVLYRSEKTSVNGPFWDSYHNINIFIEAIYWNIDSNQLCFNKIKSPNTESKGYFKSVNYFRNYEYDKIQGIDNYNPLNLINMYLTKNKTNVIDVLCFADFINKNTEQVIATILRLVDLGYLDYDSVTKTAYPKESLFYAIKAKNGKIDYDVIKIESVTQNRVPNMILDLKTLDFTVNGVDKVTVSDAKNVSIIPYNSSIILKKDLDFEFSGKLSAGLFEFYTHASFFKYNDFVIDLPDVDSISFFVKNNDAANTYSKDYVRVKNVIADLSGIIYIDQNTNKSGLVDNPDFPIFDCVKNSFVYFNKPYINQGKLDKEKFYYVVDPFRIDSLFTFSTSDFHLTGILHSGSIFPEITEPLIVMNDYSLGFDHKTNDKGYSLYDKAMYNNDIHLSNKGFSGNGTINYLTSFIESSHFDFYLDSVHCQTDKFEMLAQDDAASYPYALVDTINMRWSITDSVMYLETLKKPIEMYENSTFFGQASLKENGFLGKGLLNIEKARVKSKYFDFNYISFTADSSDFAVLADTIVAFLASNYWSSVDFNSRNGHFKYLDENSTLTFPFNKYICTLDEAEWSMDQGNIAITNSNKTVGEELANMSLSDIIDINSSGSEFISTHPSQDSLAFYCLRADYDMNDYSIIARDVKIIRVSDAAVFPSDGIVHIKKDAEIDPLANVTIIADTASRKYTFSDANVSILGIKEYHADGYYQYVDKDGDSTRLYFSKIYPDTSGVTVATSNITEFDNFMISKNFGFNGIAYITANQQNMRFNGCFLLTNSCPTEFQWFKADTLINTDSVAIPFATSSKYNSPANGLYFDKDNHSCFVSFLSDNLIDKPDDTAAFINGIIRYDAENNLYSIISKDDQNRNKSISLQTDSCFIIGESTVNLGIKSSFIDFDSYGKFYYDMNNDTLSLDLISTLNFIFDTKLIGILADSLTKSPNYSINLIDTHYLEYINPLLSEENQTILKNEIATAGFLDRIPSVYDKTIVFPKLKLKWINGLNCFVSDGPIAIANMKKNQVNKYVNGYVFVNYNGYNPVLTLYFKPNDNLWYYFSYSNGFLEAISSSDEFNNRLMEISEKQRHFKNKKSDEEYEFGISDFSKVSDFMLMIKYIENR